MVTCSELCVSKKKGKNSFTDMIPLMSLACAFCMVLSDAFFNAGMFDSPVADMMVPAMILIFCPAGSSLSRKKAVFFPLLMAVIAVAVPVVRIVLMMKNMHDHILPFTKIFPVLLALIMLAFLGMGVISETDGQPAVKQSNLAVFFFLLIGAVYYKLYPGITLLAVLFVLSLMFFAHLYTGKARSSENVLPGKRRMAAGRPAGARTGNFSLLYSRLQTLFEEKKPYLDENITVGEVAKMLYTNKAYLSRAINDHTGKNFCQYVNHYRIMHSMQIFRQNPGLRVTELAEASGFHTIVSFNMAFRLVTNESPGEWCKRIRHELETKTDMVH